MKSIKVPYKSTIVSLFSLALILFSCSTMKQGISEDGCVRIKAADAVDHMPGVYSNLKSDREIGITLLLECADSVQLKHVLYQDVQLEVSSYRHRGIHYYGSQPTAPRAFELFVYTNMLSFNKGARPKAVEVIDYQKSGYQLGDSVAVVYQVGTELYRTKAEKLFIGEQINHP